MIVVTAPTGQIGSQVVDNLIHRGADIRVIVRDPGHLPADRRARVEVLTGSHGDPAVLAEALRGADALFWLLPPDPEASSVEEAYLGFTEPAVDVIRRSGVPRVVGIMVLGRGTPQADDAGFVTASPAMDDLIASSGAAYRAVTDLARAKSEGLDNAEPRNAENTTPTSFRQGCGEELKPAVRRALQA